MVCIHSVGYLRTSPTIEHHAVLSVDFLYSVDKSVLTTLSVVVCSEFPPPPLHLLIEGDGEFVPHSLLHQKLRIHCLVIASGQVDFKFRDSSSLFKLLSA